MGQNPGEFQYSQRGIDKRKVKVAGFQRASKLKTPKWWTHKIGFNLSCSPCLKSEAWEQEGEKEQMIVQSKKSVPKFTFLAKAKVEKISRKVEKISRQSQNKWLKQRELSHDRQMKLQRSLQVIKQREDQVGHGLQFQREPGLGGLRSPGTKSTGAAR